jgi:hypothetical protein
MLDKEISEDMVGNKLVKAACAATNSTYGECYVVSGEKLEMTSKGRFNKALCTSLPITEDNLPGLTYLRRAPQLISNASTSTLFQSFA